MQVWGYDDSRLFSVNSVYACLAKHHSSCQHEVFMHIWKIKVFPNVITTTWRVLLGRIPTRESLRRRAVSINVTLCALCQTKEESCQHIFIECGVAKKVWSLCFRWIGIMFVQHNDILTHFENFVIPYLGSRQNLLWKCVRATCIWDQRNEIVFKQEVVDVEEIFQMVQLKSWLWLKHRAHAFSYSFADWVMNPLICIRSYK